MILSYPIHGKNDTISVTPWRSFIVFPLTDILPCDYGSRSVLVLFWYVTSDKGTKKPPNAQMQGMLYKLSLSASDKLGIHDGE